MGGFTAALQRFGIGRLAMILGVGAGVAAILVAVMMRVRHGLQKPVVIHHPWLPRQGA